MQFRAGSGSDLNRSVEFKPSYKAVLGIRIRNWIRMFLGLPDRIHWSEVRIRILRRILRRILSFSLKGVERTEIMLKQKIKFLRLKILCLQVSYEKKY
jgi:hypothetical protein